MFTSKSTGRWLLACTLPLALVACERPPVEDTQIGFRGVAMGNVQNPRELRDLEKLNQIPEPQPPTSAAGPKAGDIYQNVEVLGDLSIGQFTRLMAAITEWVAPPEQGCNYCHVGENFASEDIYTKGVARRMLQMNYNINSEWTAHVADTGVTCWTCHRGKGVPEYVWAKTGEERYMATGFSGNRFGQNIASEAVGIASLPNDPFSAFLLGDTEIGVASDLALPSEDHQVSIKSAEWTYGLMMHMSSGLGVNCTYCHNTRVFNQWEESTPQRATAWHGIRMAREINSEYIQPLAPVFPDNRLGPLGDPYKVNCQTCHQGLNKPLYGVSMLPDYPELDLVRE